MATDDGDISVVTSSRQPPKPPADDAKEGKLRLARDRFAQVVEAESLLRQEQLMDKRFRAGQQWNENERVKRRKQHRPCLTVNRIPQFVKQVTGALQANRQDIQVSPVDDDGDPDVADVFTGLIKHIENISHAEVALDTAAEDMAVMGRGYLRLVTQWADDDAWVQDILIRRIRNAHSVYYDPRCLELDYSDAMYAFVCTDYSEEEFKRQFPQADLDNISEDDFDDLGDYKKYWWTENNTIRVAEYFYVDFEDVIYARLTDGRTMLMPDAEKAIAESTAEVEKQLAQIEQQAQATGQQPDPTMLEQLQASMLRVEQQRPGKKRTIRCCVLNGMQILKESVWAGRWIPIIPMLGDEIDLDGRVDYRGIVRDARDQQRLYNYHVSSLVEVIGMTPRAPWVIAQGQIQGYEKIWKSANTESHAYLPYNAISQNGTYAAPPQRNTFEPAIQAIVQAIQQADNDFKATTGLYDASLGERGPEQSGKAILARQKQGEIGSIHFSTGARRCQWALGRQLVDLIPKIWDVARVARILGKDGKQRAVMVHGGKPDTVPDALPKGVQRIYDLSVGRYDVVVGQGPSTETRRQQSVEMMATAVQANPELMQMIGDLYFGAMDDPKMRQIGERLKKMLPPAVQDEDGEPDPAKLQAMIAQLKQQLQQQGELLAQASEEIRTKKIESDNKREIEFTKAELQFALKRIDFLMAQMDRDAQFAADMRKHDVDVADRREERAANRQDKDADRQFQRENLTADRQHAREDRDLERQDRQADRGAQRDTQVRQLHANRADKVFDAELQRIGAKADEARASREREEDRADMREERAFQLKQQQAEQAQGDQPAQGGGQ